MTDKPVVLLTGAGKRYDIVSAFAQHTFTVAVDPNPLAPARYAAQAYRSAPAFSDSSYISALEEICSEFSVDAIVPLTDLDIEVLAHARQAKGLPAFVGDPENVRRTFDKYETHLMLGELGLPSAPTFLPGETPATYPVIVKPRQGSGSRSIQKARTREEMEFFVGYSDEPTVVQQFMNGPEFSIDVLNDLEGNCLNAVPRSMIESRGGESVKGSPLADRELIELGRDVAEALDVRGPCMVQGFRDPELGFRITDINTRFGGGFPSHMYAALEGRTYPELIIRMAAGERIEPHVGEFRSGVTFARYYWHLELDDKLLPTGRDFVPGGPPKPRR